MSRVEHLAEGVTLHCGDMLEVLPAFYPGASSNGADGLADDHGKSRARTGGATPPTGALPFDAIVTDPPYGIGESNKNFASRSKLANADKYARSDWDSQPISTDHINAMLDRSTWQVIFGGNYFVLGPTSCWLVWDKQNTGDFADCELAWTNLPIAVRRIYWRWNGMIRKGNEDREHPTQKPLGVMEWCLTHIPDDAKTICDPFMGSGTTGVAAVKSGRQFIGIERDERYFNIACRRIAAALKEPDLFIEAPQPMKQEALPL